MRQTRREYGVVMRPYRAVVIAHGIEPRLRRGDRADAPSRELPTTHQVADKRCRSMRQRDLAEQGMAGVRGTDTARPLLAVERQDVGPQSVVPEGLVEATA